jgi:predicted transcriptional regulator
MSRYVFGPEFAHAVRVRGLTLTELARRADVCVPTASSAVRGRPVNLATAIRLARVVKATPVIPELELWIGREAVPTATRGTRETEVGLQHEHD